MEINKLPNEIAIFPLSNAVFFPRTVLPLNIFEERYLQLVEDCIKENRMFGMTQPKNKNTNFPDLYNVGCLGKITSFNETSDRRFIINLSGIIRFKIKDELKTKKLYRKFKVGYEDFAEDLELKYKKLENYNKNLLIKKIKLFFNKVNYPIEFSELAKLDVDQIVNSTCMISPFTVEEKQKLVETVQIENKIKILEEIINFKLIDLQENRTIQ